MGEKGKGAIFIPRIPATPQGVFCSWYHSCHLHKGPVNEIRLPACSALFTTIEQGQEDNTIALKDY